MLPAALQPYAEAIAAYLQQPAAWFVPLNELATRPEQSRVGGWPYLPQNQTNPLLDETGAHRYNLLLQLNLAEVPAPRPRFLPAQGLLQVFTLGFEDVLDLSEKSFRLRYYPTVDSGPAALVTDSSAFDFGSLDGYANVPPEGLTLAWQSRTANRVEVGDNGADLAHLFAGIVDVEDRQVLLDQLIDYVEAYSATIPDDDSAWESQLLAQYAPAGQPGEFQSPLSYGGFSIPDHQLGGVVPQFWQGDPRLEWDDTHDRPWHDRLLLAYDARGNCTTWPVPFLGDDAKLLFFINRDALASGDFSDIVFEYMA